MKPEIQLLVSIDTEEDDWRPTREGVSVDNTRQLPELQRFLVGLGVRPTYFANFAVADDPAAAAVLAELHGSGRAEIGAHLHPWNTPPLDEAFRPENTMLCNLPPALQAAKLARVCEALAAVTGSRPRAFRAGRLGLGEATVGLLLEAGFRVDSSVMPFVDWRGEAGPDYRRAPIDAYWLDADCRDLAAAGSPGGLREVPLSCGFTRSPFGWRAGLHRALRRGPLGRLPLGGLASRLDLARRVILSPETDELEDLVRASRALVASGARALQLFFHSPSLVPGLGPFVRDTGERERFHSRIAGWVEALARDYRLRPATVSEAGEALLPEPASAPR